MTVIEQIAQDNIRLLGQLESFTKQISDTFYSQHNESLASGSIGAHIRHIIEHYLSLLNYQNSATVQTINYDQRQRSIPLEIDTKHTQEVINSVCEQLVSICLDTEVNVVCSTNTRIRSAIQSSPEKEITTQSSLARELVFLCSHTTHHMAIIRLLSLHLKIDLPSSFGKAASTQNYECTLRTSSDLIQEPKLKGELGSKGSNNVQRKLA